MAIQLKRLSAWDFRSYEAYELEPAAGTTILVGRNAVGKTNLVEALQLVTAGASFRKPAPRELVREGAETARVDARLEGEDRVIDVRLDVSAHPAKKTFRKNGKACPAAGVRGILPSVLFCPDHLDMVKRSASVRRAALDDFGMQLNDRYAQLVGFYERSVEQRNALLKEPYPDQGLLEAWDESLSATGAALLTHRTALLARLRRHIEDVYALIAPHEKIGVSYQATIGPVEGVERDELAARLAEAYRAGRADELRRGMTLVGPHRDEIAFEIDGRDARSYGSQGQQRSVVLAWKMAEVRVTHDILGRYPLLLLDDVMSELDATRRAAIMSFAGSDVQTVVTTTNLGYFSDKVLERAKVVEIGGA